MLIQYFFVCIDVCTEARENRDSTALKDEKINNFIAFSYQVCVYKFLKFCLVFLRLLT